MQRVHARMIENTLGKQLIGHISRDSTAIDAREPIAKQDKAEVAPAKLKNKRGRPQKGEVRPTPEPSPLERQRSQTLAIRSVHVPIDMPHTLCADQSWI